MKSKENDATGRKRRKIIYFYEKKILKMKSVQKTILRYVRPSRPAGKKLNFGPGNSGPDRYP